MIDYRIRQIHQGDYNAVRRLDRDAFEYNECGSDGYWHEIFGDNIRRSPYYIPALELVAVTDEDSSCLGHAIFSALPMGDDGEHIIWLSCLAVKHGKTDNHTEKSYEYQRKGIGTALVMRGLEIAKSLGYTGCMVEGHPDVYRKKMGFSGCRSFGIECDSSVNDPDGCIHAIELTPGGFDKTNKLLSYSYYDFGRSEKLIQVLCKLLGTSIKNAAYKSKRLHGGTLGDVRLISGEAVTDDGKTLPFKVVRKTQKKWSRYGDPGSWRREYDLYASDLGSAFDDSLRWPRCLHAEINAEEDQTEIWMEYIEGVSGLDLTGDMYQRAALELGRFQGRLYAQKPGFLADITNLSGVDYAKNFYLHYRSYKMVYDYIRGEDCEIPRHLCKMLIELDENSDEIFGRIQKLPVVLCHRDFWVTNIFYADGNIRLIDWDTAGLGYLGEDLASLIADEADVSNMAELYHRCVPAYYRGFGEHVDVSHITDDCVWEFILILFGYRLVEWYLEAKTPQGKALQIATLEEIYRIKHRSTPQNPKKC